MNECLLCKKQVGGGEVKGGKLLAVSKRRASTEATGSGPRHQCRPATWAGVVNAS